MIQLEEFNNNTLVFKSPIHVPFPQLSQRRLHSQLVWTKIQRRIWPQLFLGGVPAVFPALALPLPVQPLSPFVLQHPLWLPSAQESWQDGAFSTLTLPCASLGINAGPSTSLQPWHAQGMEWSLILFECVDE